MWKKWRFEVFATAIIYSNRLREQVKVMRAVSFIPLALPFCFGCPNKCSRNGICTPLGICACNKGFGGGDCSIRTCPSGVAFSDVAGAIDNAHKNLQCSGKGMCINGNCVCSAGFTGSACERSKEDKLSRTCQGEIPLDTSLFLVYSKMFQEL